MLKNRSQIISFIGIIVIAMFFCASMVTASVAVSAVAISAEPDAGPTPVPAPAPRAGLEPAPATPTLAARAGLEPAPTRIPNPRPKPTPSPTPKPIRKELLGFDMYSFKSGQAAYSLMEKNKDLLTSIASSTYSIGKSGELLGRIADWQVSFANKNKITPILLVTNSFDNEVSKSLLADPKAQATAIDNMAKVLKLGNYRGINIDFESVYAADRDKYTEFIKQTYLKLHPKGYMVTVSVPAKSVDDPRKTWVYAYDYKSIGKYSDRILIMTYDEHYKKGSPGPVASFGWVKSVMTYAASVIPPNKLYLGLSAYGYDWGANIGVSYSVEGCYNLASSHNAKIEFDPVAKCPHFDYTDSDGTKHQVWFENDESISYKLELVKSLKLKGVGVWRMGTMDKNYWDMLRKKL